MDENLIKTQKDAFRQSFLRRRREISPMERMVLNGAIAGQILSMEVFANAPGIVGYASDATEPELRGVLEEALAQHKKAALPRFNAARKVYEPVLITDFETDLVAGKYNLPEPRPELPIAEVDKDWLWLIPGVAFDGFGTRLGRGKGFYDRMLDSYPGNRVGVFYQCQMSEKALPCGEFDQPLTMAVTEKKVYNF